jgi:hypothetical protein
MMIAFAKMSLELLRRTVDFNELPNGAFRTAGGYRMIAQSVDLNASHWFRSSKNFRSFWSAGLRPAAGPQAHTPWSLLKPCIGANMLRVADPRSAAVVVKLH